VGINEEIFKTLYVSGALSVLDISRKTTIHRTRVYQALSELEGRELVVPLEKGRRTLYLALSPEKLRNMFARVLAEVEVDLPLLASAYKGTKVAPTVVIHHGREGLTSVFADLVAVTEKGGVFIRVSSERDKVTAQSYLPKALRDLRDKKGLERFVIASEKVWKGSRVPLGMAEKLIPTATAPLDQNVIELVYGNKIAIMDLTSETAFVVEGTAIADFHRTLFRLLYQRL